MFNSYLTRICVCNIVVRRERNSALEVGTDSSAVDEERVEVIAVGELGAEPEAACRLSDERDLIMLVALLSAVRKSSTVTVGGDTIGPVDRRRPLRSESSISNATRRVVGGEPLCLPDALMPMMKVKIESNRQVGIRTGLDLVCDYLNFLPCSVQLGLNLAAEGILEEVYEKP